MFSKSRGVVVTSNAERTTRKQRSTFVKSTSVYAEAVPQQAHHNASCNRERASLQKYCHVMWFPPFYSPCSSSTSGPSYVEDKGAPCSCDMEGHLLSESCHSHVGLLEPPSIGPPASPDAATSFPTQSTVSGGLSLSLNRSPFREKRPLRKQMALAGDSAFRRNSLSFTLRVSRADAKVSCLFSGRGWASIIRLGTPGVTVKARLKGAPPGVSRRFGITRLGSL